MAFLPNVGDSLQIEDVEYFIAEHPAAPGIPYGQEGRAAVVYQVTSSAGNRALKVFKKRFRLPSLVALSERLAPFAALQGLTACTRTVLTARKHADLLREHPDLTYAVLMPWIDGPNWSEVMLDKRALSPEQALLIAQTLGGILAGMEEQGVAHCDLSGPNVLIPALVAGLSIEKRQSEAPVELVDVEQLFGPGLERPEVLLAGSQGYAAYHAIHGDLWNAKADRFAGAMLLSEVLGWCDPRVREAAWGETYFDPEEIQSKESERYHILTDSLRTRWGTGVTDLLEYAWRSDTLDDCPNFGEWLVMMPGEAPGKQVVAMSPEVKALMDKARKQEQAGDTVGALATYRQAQQAAAPGSALAEELSLIVASLQEQLNPPPAAPAPAPAAQPSASGELDRLFGFAVAAYNRGEWSSSREMLREIVRAQPGYAKNGQRAAELLADVERRLAPQPTAAPAAQPVQPIVTSEPAPVVVSQAAPQPPTPVAPLPGVASPQPAASDPPAPVPAPAVAAATAPPKLSAEEKRARRKRRDRRWAIAEGIVALLALLLVGALVLSQLKPASSSAGQGNNNGAATPLPAIVAATQTAALLAQVAATPTSPPQPTTTAAPPTPSPVPVVQAAGLISFHDNINHSDQLTVALNPAPSIPLGKGLIGWLTGSANGKVLKVGRLLPDANNTVNLTYNAPDNTNLLGQYDGFKVTAEDLETDPTAPSGDVLISGQLPAGALMHIGHLLVADPGLPNSESVFDGLLGQLTVLRQHAEFLQQSQAAGNFANVRLHAEHIVNIIEGTKGPHYGDLNKDGKAQNPGDGLGLLVGTDQLGYLQHTTDHANNAAAAPDATDNIKLHAGHVAISIENVRGWVSTIRDRALDVLAAKNLQETKPLSDEIIALANRAINGQPVGNEGQVQPVPGSGGAMTAYQHAQLMAGIPLVAIQGAANTPVPQAQPATATTAPTPPPPTATTAAAPPAPSGGSATVNITGFAFGDPITVKVGTTVTWTNSHNFQHTVTADDNSFDSGTLQKGQTFSQTFTKAGTFPYYCVFHGGPGGQGMASKVIVEP